MLCSSRSWWPSDSVLSRRSLGGCDRGFESHSGHGCLVFVHMHVFFCVCELVEALRWANHPSKESYRPSWLRNWVKSALCSETGARSHVCGSNEEEKKIVLRPIMVAARSKVRTVFASSNVEFVGSNLTQGMDVCVRLFSLGCPMCKYRPCARLITRPRSPTDSVK
jgi:hypothetical protein